MGGNSSSSLSQQIKLEEMEENMRNGRVLQVADKSLSEMQLQQTILYVKERVQRKCKWGFLLCIGGSNGGHGTVFGRCGGSSIKTYGTGIYIYI